MRSSVEEGEGEQGEHGKEVAGAGHSDPGDESRTAAVREGPLDAEHGNGPHGDRCGDPYEEAAKKYFDYLQSHIEFF